MGGTLLFIAILAGLQSIGLKGVPNLFPVFAPPTSDTGTSPATAQPPEEKNPSLSFTLKTTKNGNTLLVRWENLPADASLLKIFRSRAGENKWLIWKTLTITSATGGADIKLTAADAGNFSYYGEVVSASSPGGTTSTVLWSSSPAIPSPAPPDAAATPPPSSGTPPPAQSTSSQQQAKTPPAQTTTTPPSSGAGTAPPAGQESTSTIYYYTPQVQVSSTSTPSTAEFWVYHTDQKIEIGWQNLPTSTTKIIVLRAPQESGAWAAVLTQQNPDPVGPFKIKLDDETLRSDQYYKLEARAANTLIATYGPILLPAL